MGGQDEFGKLLRKWREHRRLSQLALACNAEISSKHLSFLETGRAAPSREMILKLAEELQVPLRQRNVLLTAGGYAEVFTERPLSDPRLQTVGEVVQMILTGHEPNPAMAIDHCWNILATNQPLRALIQGAAPALLQPTMNAMRLALHPEGLAPAILNFAEWRTHALAVIKQRAETTANPEINALLDEVRAYRYTGMRVSATEGSKEGFAIPCRFATSKGTVNLITTSMVFGFPRDITVSELAIECLFPTDKESAAVLQALAQET